jgi:hypothetical protein
VFLCPSPLSSLSLLSCPLGCSSTSIPHKQLVGIQHNVVDIKHVAMQLVVVVIRVVHRAVLRVAIRHVVERSHPPIDKQTVLMTY